MKNRADINSLLYDKLAVKESDIRSVQKTIDKIYDYKNVTVDEVQMIREMLSEELADEVSAFTTSYSYLRNRQLNAKVKGT